MKHPTLHSLFFLLVALSLSMPSFAQAPISEKKNDELITVTITHTDGTVTVLKKHGSVKDIKDLISSFGKLDGSTIRTVDVARGNEPKQRVQDEQLIYIRKAGSMKIQEVETEVESEVRVRAQGYTASRGESYTFESGEAKPFMGVYLGGKRAEGVRISGVVEGSGAEKGGLEDEDVITSIDGISLQGESSLSKALYQFKPGQSVTVGYVRKGRPGFAEITLTSKGYRYSAHYEENPCQVFIGVYTSTHRDGGVDVQGVINNTPAFESGVKPGDVILALDGVTVETHGQLKVERDKHELGDPFTLDIDRGGQMLQIQAQFPTCEEIQESAVEETPVLVEEVIVKEEIEAPEEPIEEQRIGQLDLLEFEAFPNPTINYVNVRFQGESKPLRLQVINSSGQIILEDIQNQFDGIYNKRLNLEGVATGTYYIRVIQDNKVKTESLLVVPRV